MKRSQREPRRGGKKNRKHGRKRKKPAQIRYTLTKRWITNKAKKIAKYKRKHPNWGFHLK